MRVAVTLLLSFLAAPATAQGNSSKAILAAAFVEPATRYGHDVLGPGMEWGALRIRVDLCPPCRLLRSETVTMRLPEDLVFEDVAPRETDLDGDGEPELIVVESHLQQGSRLAIWGPGGRIAATPFIGRANRWLAPVGAADLDGDGAMEIAYVDRPHLARVLRVWRYSDGTLTEVAALEGLTNHRIGEPFISGGIRDCGTGPEIVTADANWRRILATRLLEGGLSARDIGPFGGRDSMQAVLDCE